MRKISASRYVVITIFLCVLCFVSTSFAGVEYVRSINLGFKTLITMNQWYDYIEGTDPAQGAINFQSEPVSGTSYHLQTYGDDIYELKNATFTFVSALESDISSGGWAKGYFEGGAAVSLSATLSIGESDVYTGKILDAVLKPTYADPSRPTEDLWLLSENLAGPIIEPDQFSQQLYLELVDPASGENLTNGIAIAGTDIVLKMMNPTMDLFLKAESGDAFNFLDDMQTPMFTEQSTVNITGVVPEPATLALFALGGLVAIGERKR